MFLVWFSPQFDPVSGIIIKGDFHNLGLTVNITLDNDTYYEVETTKNQIKNMDSIPITFQITLRYGLKS